MSKRCVSAQYIIATIAKHFGCRERMVQRAIQALEANGLLVALFQNGQRSYRVQVKPSRLSDR
jgi:hypothetical protein